jgi:imidazolonepropionase-like amidohydrolase
MKPGRCLSQVALAVLCTLVPGLLAMPGLAQSADAPVAYRNATFITGDGRVLADGVMLVRAGVIEAIGALASTPLPPEAMTVDLQGRTVMPALIDAHAHIGYEAYTGWGAEHYGRENILENLQRYAWYGFGAVFSAGSDPLELARDIEAARESGAYHGARLLVASGMAPPGQGPNAAFLAHVLAVEARTGQRILRGAATAQQGRDAVREIAATGSGFIKIWVDDRGGVQQKMPAEVYRAIADEARQFGIRVLVHQQAAADMPGLISAGISGFLHGRIGPELDEAMAAAMAERDIFLVPNLGLSELRWERLADDPFLTDLLPAAVVQRLGEAFAARAPAGPAPRYEQDLREGMARLQAAGVDIVLGTDAGAVRDHFFGYAGHRELEIFVRLGMTPLQAIHAATGLAAQHLGLTDTGTLTAGKRADFVVLDASPLDDIRHTRRIQAVFLGGVAFDREAFQQAARPAQSGAHSPQ